MARSTRSLWILAALSALGSPALGAEARNWRKTALSSPTPDSQVLYEAVSGSGKPDILERWWNGKRVRWLDEGGTLKVGDLRGDLVNGLLQIDLNGDGLYDGPDDMAIKWCDTKGSGIPDLQAIVANPHQWGPTREQQKGHPLWMVFINHDRRGVLGWMDWAKFKFACWDFTDQCNWLPNYHGNNDFVKTHAPPWALSDPRINWENPFSFYDEDGDGVPEMVLRWCAPVPHKEGKLAIPPTLDSAFLSLDLDNNSGKGNETSYDMTLTGAGGKIDISDQVHPLKNYRGLDKFDPCFQYNQWRKIPELLYMDRNKGYEKFFSSRWRSMYLTFDEDGDDHRWERVESLYPTTNYTPSGPPVDIYSTARFNADAKVTPGLCGAFQSDTLGDRGEFDLDNSGGGKLYIGGFDRKLHLFGAEWGAWTVDKNAQYHGGAGEPTHHPEAKKVEELVKYTDTDGDGFFDLIEYDYRGTGTFDLKINLLDYRKPGFDPQKCALIEPGKLGWKGMHELFNAMAQSQWEEAQRVYRAAWRKDLTNPELDRLYQASSMMQRYQNAYWIKENIFRLIAARVLKTSQDHPDRAAAQQAFLSDYIRSYYTGDFNEVVKLIEAL